MDIQIALFTFCVFAILAYHLHWDAKEIGIKVNLLAAKFGVYYYPGKFVRYSIAAISFWVIYGVIFER